MIQMPPNDMQTESVLQELAGLRLDGVDALTLGDVHLRTNPDNERSIIAEYRSLAQLSPDDAFAAAEVAFGNMLTSLRYALLCIVPTGTYIIGKYGEMPPTSTVTNSVMQRGDYVHLHSSFTISHPFKISRSKVEALHNYKIHEVHALLGKKEKSDLEQALEKAIRLCANASSQRSMEDKHVQLVKALEAIFNSSPGEPGRKQAICDGLCTLTGDPGWQPILTRQYKLRSKGVHGATVQIAKADVFWVSRAITATIIELLSQRGKFPTKKSLQSWIETQKVLPS